MVRCGGWCDQQDVRAKEYNVKIGDVASDSFFLVQLDSDPSDLVGLLRARCGRYFR